MYKYVVSPGNNGAIVKSTLEARGCWTEASESEAHDLKAHLVWKQTVLPIRSLQMLEQNQEKGGPATLHNHLDNNREITTKPGLIRSLRGYYQTCEGAVHCSYHAYDSMATSFIITAACEDLEYHSLINRYTELQTGSATKERMPGKHCQENIWLIKPAALNQGRGIEICHSLKEIKAILSTKLPNSVWVVQKYIERPLLFKGRKFDIRVWALATARKELFFYKLGYLRTSSFDYSTGAKDNYIHLTNNCLQKWGDNYGIHEAGNTLSFDAFQEYLDAEFPDLGVNVREHIVTRIKDLIIDSYLSARKILHGSKRKNAFELLGYDFLIDEDFRVWLLEVNTNPYLGIPNDYIKELLPAMLDEMASIAIDPYYPPPSPHPRTRNDFELLYCETSSPWSPDGLGKNYRRPFNTPIYPFPALAQVSLCRQNNHTVKSDDEGEAKPKPPLIVRDTFTTLKEILDGQLFYDVSDFAVITARVMSHLQNWELASKEQIGSALQALRLLCGSPGNAALISYGHISALLGFVQSENMHSYMQIGVIEALIAGCADTRFKRELAKSSLIPLLIPIIISPRDEENIFPKHLQLLFAMSRHPTKNVYIPGESRENNFIRDMFIAQGGLTCLYKLSQEAADEAMRNDIRQHLSSEFGLADWDAHAKILGKAIRSKDRATAEARLPSSLPPTALASDGPMKLNSAKKQPSPDTSFSSSARHIHVQFPEALLNTAFLQRVKGEVEEFCELRRNEIKQRQTEDARRKEEEYDEKLKLREEEDRAYEDRRQKAENDLLRRYSERKQKKLEEMKKQLQEKALEDRLDEERRLVLLEKLKKQEEMRKFEKMRKKQEVEDQKRQDDERARQQEERRRAALNEWLKLKGEQERDRRLKEKLQREREEAKRIEELNQRRIELQMKLDERKGKKPKLDKVMKDNPHQSLAISSFADNLELTKQRSTRLEEKKTAEVGDTKAVPQSQPQPAKKRKQVLPDQLLLEVYRQLPVFAEKKRKRKRTHSKADQRDVDELLPSL